MPKLIDLTNKTFNMLIVVKRAEGSYSKIKWECLCESENTAIVEGNKLKNGHTKSCGCLFKKVMTQYRKKNTIKLVDSHYEVTDGQGKIFLLDSDDIHLLNDKYWFINHVGYAMNRELGFMHRLLTNAPNGMDVDHINHNRADNRKETPRVISHMENMWNMKATGKDTATGYKGVSFHEKTGKYRSAICSNGKRKHLGVFEDIEEGIAARIKAEQEIRGLIISDWKVK